MLATTYVVRNRTIEDVALLAAVFFIIFYLSIMGTKLLDKIEKSMPMTTYLNDDSQFNNKLDNSIVEDFNITAEYDNRRISHVVQGCKINYFEGIDTFWYFDFEGDISITEMSTGCSVFIINKKYLIGHDEVNNNDVSHLLDMLLKEQKEPVSSKEIKRRVDLYFNNFKQLKLLVDVN